MKLLSILICSIIFCLNLGSIEATWRYIQQDLGVYYVNSFHWFTWQEAFDSCLDRNMTLVEIQNEDEYENVKDAIIKSGTLVPAYWIGLHDVDTENDFVWATSGNRMSFSDFKHNEPNNGGTDKSNEDCVEIVPKRLESNMFAFEWNDAPCDSQKGYICYADEKRHIKILSTEFWNDDITIQLQRSQISSDNSSMVYSSKESNFNYSKYNLIIVGVLILFTFNFLNV